MIVAELVRSSAFPLELSPYSPFVYMGYVHSYSYASFWTTVFGAPDDSEHRRTNVRQITRDYLNKYLVETSIANCQAQEGSFYFDDAAQIIYIHMEHGYAPYSSAVEYGYAFGVTDQEVLYFDDYEYLPLIESLPNIESSADFVGATKVTGASGTAKLRNSAVGIDGPLDFLISENVYGNDFFIYHYDPVTQVLTPRACFFIEDYSFDLTGISIILQDKRKAQNIKVPVSFFDKATYPYLDDASIGKVIPLAYGTISEMELIPVNPNEANTDPTVRAQYRMPDGMTSIGTAYVWINNKEWTPANAPVANFNDMTITIDCGDNISTKSGRDDSGTTRRLKLVNCAGIMFSGHSYPADIILDLNARFLGLQYTSANYDTTEWAAEVASSLIAADIGFVIEEQRELFEIIFDVCNKSKTIFRYEFTPLGKITIRVRDFDRTALRYIESVDIKNRDLISVDSDSANVYSSVIIKYFHNYVENSDLTLENLTHYDEAASKYRNIAALPLVSFLVTKADASARAATDALAFSEIPRIVKLELFGNLDLKIFETLDVALSTDDLYSGSRQYFGFRKCLVLSINPDDATGTNSITALVGPTASMAENRERAIADSYVFPYRENVQETAVIAQAAHDLATDAAQSLIRISCSAPVVFRHSSGAYHPASILFSAATPGGSPYPGRWKLYRGNHLEYESVTDEAIASINCDLAPSNNVGLSDDLGFGSSTFRAELYAAGGTTTKLDTYSTSTLNDVDGFADAYAALAGTSAQIVSAAYADGIVTAEETRAIADAQAKATVARITAQAYADGIVTVEEARAIVEAKLLAYTTAGNSLLIPLYIYPSSGGLTTEYATLVALAKANRSVNIYVVLNPSSGPGSSVDGNYTDAIKKLQGAGIQVLGYVHTSYPTSSTVGRTLAAVEADIDTWVSLYPLIDGLFVDEMPWASPLTEYIRTYFQELLAYARARTLAPVVANPGSAVVETYYTNNLADVIVVAEGAWPTEAALRDYSYNTDHPNTKKAVLAYGVSSWNLTTFQMVKKYTGMLYCNDGDSTPYPWDTLTAKITYQFSAMGLTTIADVAASTRSNTWKPTWIDDFLGSPAMSVQLLDDGSMAGKAAGIYYTQSYMGHWTGSAFDSFIKSDNTWKFKGDGTHEISWNGSVMTLAGAINLVDAVGTPGASGLYIGSDKMGYYKTGAGAGWKTYQDNTGKFYLVGTGVASMAWDGAALTINGNFKLAGAGNYFENYGGTIRITPDTTADAVEGIVWTTYDQASAIPASIQGRMYIGERSLSGGFGFMQRADYYNGSAWDAYRYTMHEKYLSNLQAQQAFTTSFSANERATEACVATSAGPYWTLSLNHGGTIKSIAFDFTTTPASFAPLSYNVDIGQSTAPWENIWANHFLSATTSVTSTSFATWFTPVAGEVGLISCSNNNGGNADLYAYSRASATGTTVIALIGSGLCQSSAAAVQIKSNSSGVTMTFTRMRLL